MIEVKAQPNIDEQVVKAFGEEWTQFDQRAASTTDLQSMFDQFFRIFPWDELPSQAVGFDLGCGSGRWARFVSQRATRLHCIDPSEAALSVARNNLRDLSNCVFHLAPVDQIPLANSSMDFGYAIGVLHHIPDTVAGIRSCVRKLKAGAPFLLYLYYAFDNRPLWFRMIWRATNVVRTGISRCPFPLRYILCQVIAALVYWPLARVSFLLERLGFNVEALPLSWYRRRNFYTLRTDALDRFGTRLEKRFTANEIAQMMKEAGLERITFNDSMPYWCAIGFKRVCAE
jgi:ubiquinone/menaquinone biosynthesis C-methylase UbiE